MFTGKKWYETEEGDTCRRVARRNDIERKELYVVPSSSSDWRPKLTRDGHIQIQLEPVACQGRYRRRHVLRAGEREPIGKGALSRVVR